MVSDTGRHADAQSATAARPRATTAAASRRAAIFLASASTRLFPQPANRGDISAQFGVELPPMRHRQTRRFPHDQGGPPFRERPALQRGQRVRHLVRPTPARTRDAGPRRPGRRGGPTPPPRPTPSRASRPGTPAASSAARRLAAHNAVARACAAAAADFNRSHRSTTARSSACDRPTSISNKLSNMHPTLPRPSDKKVVRAPAPDRCGGRTSAARVCSFASEVLPATAAAASARQVGQVLDQVDQDQVGGRVGLPPGAVRARPGERADPAGTEQLARLRRVGDHRQVQAEAAARASTACPGTASRFCSSVSRSVRIRRTDSSDSTRTPSSVAAGQQHPGEAQIVVGGRPQPAAALCRTAAAAIGAGPITSWLQRVVRRRAGTSWRRAAVPVGLT